MGAYLIAVTLFLSACSSSFVLETNATLPTSSVMSWPLKVAVLCEPQTCSHVYIENTSARPNWEVTTGPSQTELLKQTLSSLFTSTVFVDSSNEVSPMFDFVIKPTLQDIQFSLPNENYLKQYETWLQYHISVKNTRDELIAEFSINGYGKAEDSFFKNKKEGFELATNLAFRDLGAKLILGINQHPKIREKLVANSSEQVE